MIDEQRGFLRHLSASGRQFTGGYPKSRIWWDDEKKREIERKKKRRLKEDKKLGKDGISQHFCQPGFQSV